VYKPKRKTARVEKCFFRKMIQLMRRKNSFIKMMRKKMMKKEFFT